MWYASASSRTGTPLYSPAVGHGNFSTECGAVTYYTANTRQSGHATVGKASDPVTTVRWADSALPAALTTDRRASHFSAYSRSSNACQEEPAAGPCSETVYQAPRDPHRPSLREELLQPAHRTPTRRCSTPSGSHRRRPEEERPGTPRCGGGASAGTHGDENHARPRTPIARVQQRQASRTAPLRTVFVDATADGMSEANVGLLGFATQMAKDSAATSGVYSHQPAKRTRDEDSRRSRPVAASLYPLFENVVHPRHKYADAPLLPFRYPAHRHRHLLLLDLDETLVHASAQEVASYDATFTVDMEPAKVRVFVKHRPHLMELLQTVARYFEVGVFTASLSKYADQVLDHIDPRREFITHRLFREHCTMVDGSYVKDLAILGREMNRVVLMDNSPVAYLFHPQNAIPCTSWFDDEGCTELQRLIPVLIKLSRAPDVVEALDYLKRTGAIGQPGN